MDVDGTPLASAGDPDVAQLFSDERPWLLRLAFLLTSDRGAAEDLVQDAFLALHRRRATLHDPVAAAGYLRTSVVNGARSVHRRQALRRRRPELPDPGSTPGADDGVLLAEEHRLVVAAVRTLPGRQREVLVLRYWGGLSEADIAGTLGVSRGTVKTCASRGLSTLARRLGADDEH